MGVNFILQGAEANISRIKKGTEILQEEWNKTEQKAGDVFSDVRVTVKFHEGMELEVKRMKADVEIDCHEPAHFFRGLNWVLNHLEKAEGESEKKGKEDKGERNGRIYSLGTCDDHFSSYCWICDWIFFHEAKREDFGKQEETAYIRTGT